MMTNAPYDISWGSLWRMFLFVAVAAAAFFVRDALLALLLAVVLSAGIDSFVTFLERRGVPRLLGTILIFIGGLGVLGAVLYAILPVALIELNGFLAGFERSSGEFVSTGLQRELLRGLREQLTALSSFFIFGKLPLVEFGTKIVGGMVLTISIFVISFYLSVSRDGVERFLRALLPLQYEAYALD